jgi:hypothetical protein
MSGLLSSKKIIILILIILFTVLVFNQESVCATDCSQNTNTFKCEEKCSLPLTGDCAECCKTGGGGECYDAPGKKAGGGGCPSYCSQVPKLRCDPSCSLAEVCCECGGATDIIQRRCIFKATVSAWCDLCCPGGIIPPVCNKNAVCDPGEKADTCSDCVPCNDDKRKNDEALCQGGTTPNPLSPCRYCGDAGSGYEYDIPKLTTPTVQDSWPFCVNITNDPFNCNECGFIGGIEATPDDVTAGVCAGDQPYCADRECREPGTLDAAEGLQVQAYIASHSPLNPSYVYPYSSGGGVYSPDQIDSSDAACAAGGGILNPEFGCCGDGKCRVTEESICHATSICDGTSWHDESLSNQNGEVFLTPMCKSIYPVANINGEFIKCVDEDQFGAYLKSMAKAAGACIPDEYFNAFTYEFPQWHTEGHSIPWDWVEQYVCPAGTYLTEIATSTGSSGVDQCRIKPANLKVSSSGVLICTAESSGNNAGLFGFATMGDANYGNIAGWFVNPAGGEINIPLCPGPISQWDGVTTIGIPPLACPGKVNVNNVPAGTWLMVYGSNAGKRSAMFCSDNSDLKPDSTLDFMGYVKGNGTIMGNVSNHEYICTTGKSSSSTGSRAFIGICCGSTDCGDIPGSRSIDASVGIKYHAGDYINISSTYRLYCMADGKWGADLDYIYTQAACNNANFAATGNYCCSEWDDNITWTKESYNEPGGVGIRQGGCFKSVFQVNNQSLKFNSTTYNNVFVFNGTFRGCGFNDSLFRAEFEQGSGLCKFNSFGRLNNVCLQDVEDWPDPGVNFAAGSSYRTHQPLIKASDYCTVYNISSVGGVYCSFNNTWLSANGLNLSHRSYVPLPLLEYFKIRFSNPSLTNASCCQPSRCWNGMGCIDEQRNAGDGFNVSATEFYRCQQGLWMNILGPGQKTPDSCYVGYCPNSTQCLYNFYGNSNDNNNISGNPQCIANGQFIGDSLCNNGSWSSRTKLLALKLVQLAGGSNFVLMCGPSVDVLVDEQNPGRSNNFCVLNLSGQRIIGTTLNQPLYSLTNYTHFLTALENSYLLSYPDMGEPFSYSCSESTTGFAQCINNPLLKLYYDKAYGMVVFSDKSISLNPGFWDNICSGLPSWLKWLCPQTPLLEKQLAGLQLFNKVYAAKRGSTQILGVAEKVCTSWVYTFNYTSLPSTMDLGYLAYYVDAANATLTQSGSNIRIFIKNPVKDAWTALTLLRNTEQE